MNDTNRFKNEDLVLKVSPNINPAVFDINKYEAFLDSLCVDREYQKTAIRSVCNFLFGGAYQNLRVLAEENYRTSKTLKDKYPTFSLFEKQLQFPDKLACSVDHATGSGKSYIIYGLARIALASGLVDRVLVLCPSITIEGALLDKFLSETKVAQYTDVLPKDSVVPVPHVISARETAVIGSICVENRHATLTNANSAIEKSYKGNGGRTLVLCDEAHHIFSPEQESLKRWKEFLISPDYNFKYIVGFSGTCYVGNEYFADVVSRYSLRRATDEGRVKWVEYVPEDGSQDAQEKLQLIYDNHAENRQKYRLVKPLTIIVTRDISACKKVTDELIEFIARKQNLTREEAGAKVLRVHSRRSNAREDAEIPSNLLRLRSGEPDRADSKIEWVTSVSMLTEGWDVKNVFQIVPHEKRAFDSKLLIAQVLGRGLRIPPEYAGQQPVVTVFNHAAWSESIKELVNEVLEQERRIVASVVTKATNYDFEMDQIDYSKAEDVIETQQTSEYDFNMPFVHLAAQRKELERQTTYEKVVTLQRRVKTTRIVTEMYDVEQVVVDIHNRFKSIDLESGSNYATKYPKAQLRALIRASLDHIGYEGQEVSKENKQRLLSAFGNLRRPGNKSKRYNVVATSLRRLRASDRNQESLITGMLRRGSTVFYDDLSKTFDAELAQTITDIENDDSRLVSALIKIDNAFQFKTCLSVVITTGEPERKFVKGLVQSQNAAKIDAWLVSTDTGFYEIEYSYSRGDYSRRGSFNPDFFIKAGANILVVEVKDDDEIKNVSLENKGKRKAAAAHFGLLNSLQSERKYHFCFITPADYDLFFADLRDGKAMSFQSSLDVELMK